MTHRVKQGYGEFGKGDRVSWNDRPAIGKTVERTGTVEGQNYLHTFIKPDSGRQTEVISHGGPTAEKGLKKI